MDPERVRSGTGVSPWEARGRERPDDMDIEVDGAAGDGSGLSSHRQGRSDRQDLSVYGTLHAVMDEAYMRANPPGDPDPWLDLQGLDDPLWGHHSFRRCADTVARSTMAKSGVSEQDIDRVFGWLEAMYSHRMQYHYETRFNRDRRYRVTMYL